MITIVRQAGLARRTSIQSDSRSVALQRDHVQQHEEKRQAEPGPKVLLPSGGLARALYQRPRLSDRLVRVRKDNCQGNPSNYNRLTIYSRPAATGNGVFEIHPQTLHTHVSRPAGICFVFFWSFFSQRLRIRVSSKATRSCAGNGVPRPSPSCTPARWA